MLAVRDTTVRIVMGNASAGSGPREEAAIAAPAAPPMYIAHVAASRIVAGSCGEAPCVARSWPA